MNGIKKKLSHRIYNGDLITNPKQKQTMKLILLQRYLLM